MPYKFATDHLKIPRELDKRVKISETDKENIRTMFSFERLAIREIARRFEGRISIRSIDFIVHPERLARAKALHKERRKDGRYYDKAKNTAYARLHRRYKQSIINQLTK